MKMTSVNGHSKPSQQSQATVHPAKKEPEIVTLYPSGTEADPSPLSHDPSILLMADWEHSGKKDTPGISWNDTLLKKLQGKMFGQTVLWLPGSGRHVSEGPDSYRPFTHVTRTLHLEDALQVCAHWRIPPKNIITFSSIDSRNLPPGHPCADLRVLWFSAAASVEDEDQHDWYGNVEFALSASVLLERWKYSFLVEMMTTPTHTTSRILLTNTDFSRVLRPYNPFSAGGPWQVSAEGQLALLKCSRYMFKGTNRHPHILEFLLNVTKEDEREILQACELSFKNHEEAQDLTVRHVCNRHQRAKTSCPSPFPRTSTAMLFAARLRQMNLVLHNIPSLSPSAQKLYREALLHPDPPNTVTCDALVPMVVFAKMSP